MEYEVSIRILFPETINEVLEKEKDRFVVEYGSSYKSEPHITLYLDRYTEDGFPKLIKDLENPKLKSFTFSLLSPEMRIEKDRYRNLYVMEVSHKEQFKQFHDEVSRIAIPHRSPLLREKTRRRLEQQGIQADGTRVSAPEGIDNFDPHVTLGEIDFDKPQAEIAEVQKNLKQIEGEEIVVSSIEASFYGKESGAEKFKTIERVTISF
ncbi:MAG: hypothetical protein AAB864_00125 [Patescibacteria group bacterium]